MIYFLGSFTCISFYKCQSAGQVTLKFHENLTSDKSYQCVFFLEKLKRIIVVISCINRKTVIIEEDI